MNIKLFSTLHLKLANYFVMLFVASCFLLGCGDNNKSNLPAKTINIKYEAATTLKGSVSDKDGPIKFGKIIVTDDKERIVASTELQNSKHYSVEIPAGTSLPVLLTFNPASDQAETQTMITAVIYPTMTKFDINPLTTAIAKKAKAMGGYTQTNMFLAAKSSVSMPKSNQTLGGFSGDPTKQYGGWH